MLMRCTTKRQNTKQIDGHKNPVGRINKRIRNKFMIFTTNDCYRQKKESVIATRSISWTSGWDESNALNNVILMIRLVKFCIIIKTLTKQIEKQNKNKFINRMHFEYDHWFHQAQAKRTLVFPSNLTSALYQKISFKKPHWLEKNTSSSHSHIHKSEHSI